MHRCCTAKKLTISMAPAIASAKGPTMKTLNAATNSPMNHSWSLKGMPWVNRSIVTCCLNSCERKGATSLLPSTKPFRYPALKRAPVFSFRCTSSGVRYSTVSNLFSVLGPLLRIDAVEFPMLLSLARSRSRALISPTEATVVAADRTSAGGGMALTRTPSGGAGTISPEEIKDVILNKI